MFRFFHSKSILSAVLAIACLLVLAACGEENQEAGRYLCVAAEAEGFALDVNDLYPEGLELSLGTGGNGLITAGKETGSLRWRQDGTRLRMTIGGEAVEGVLEDGMIRCTLPGSDVSLRFLREDLAAALETPDPADYQESAERWCGDWFGRWSVENVRGSFAETWYDCCAVIAADEDCKHLLLRLWDEDGSAEEPMGLVEFELDPASGTAASTEGSFWFEQIGPGQWTLDLRNGPYEGMLVFRGTHESDTEQFDYEISLRPWGNRWDDVAAKESSALPFRYEWYLAQIEEGQRMPAQLPAAA